MTQTLLRWSVSEAIASALQANWEGRASAAEQILVDAAARADDLLWRRKPGEAALAEEDRALLVRLLEALPATGRLPGPSSVWPGD